MINNARAESDARLLGRSEDISAAEHELSEEVPEVLSCQIVEVKEAKTPNLIGA